LIPLPSNTGRRSLQVLDRLTTILPVRINIEIPSGRDGRIRKCQVRKNLKKADASAGLHISATFCQAAYCHRTIACPIGGAWFGSLEGDEYLTLVPRIHNSGNSDVRLDRNSFRTFAFQNEWVIAQSALLVIEWFWSRRDARDFQTSRHEMR
jgi:hypothetical protein